MLEFRFLCYNQENIWSGFIMSVKWLLFRCLFAVITVYCGVYRALVETQNEITVY